MKSVKNKICQRDSGFALIAVITLMILLSLISIALMALSVSVSRASGRTKNAEEARAQARLALQVALGNLQTELGPDQRVTAASGILSSEADDDSTQGVSNPYVLGVWNSWDTWLNRTSQKAGATIDGTYGKGRSLQFRRWLISSADESLLKKWNAVTGGKGLGKGNPRDRSRILMLGKGTLGEQCGEKEVYAELVEVDNSSGMTMARPGNSGRGQSASSGRREDKTGGKAYIAWWVSGENLKARVNLPRYRRGKNESAMEVLRHTWDTPAPDSSMIPGLEKWTESLPLPDTEEYDNKIMSIFTRGTLSLTESDRGRQKAPYFHDASFDSSGLLADVRFGGLKKDLNILMSSDDLSSTDYYENKGSDVSIRPYGAEDGNGRISNAARPLASWKQLYYWYNLWDSRKKAGQDESAPLSWKGGIPWTSIASDPEPGAEAKGESTVMNNRYTYLRQPVLLKMYVLIGFTLRYHGTYAGFFGLDGTLCGRPVFVWWNPYNVQMQAGDEKQSMGGFGFTYRVLPVQYTSKSDTDRVEEGYPLRYDWTNWFSNCFAPTWRPGTAYPGSYGFQDFGNSFRRKKDVPYFTLAPGEIKVFSNDLTYDIENNSELTLKRTVNDNALISHPEDAYPYKHQFYGHEITYVSNPQEAGSVNINIPVLWKYGAGTHGFSWMNRNDYAQSWLKMRIAAGVSSFRNISQDPGAADEAKRSLYQLHLKEGNADDHLNFTVGAGLMPHDIKSKSTEELQNGAGVQKYFPSFMNMNWLDERPYELILSGAGGSNEGININPALFDVMWDGTATRENFGVPKNEGNPFWVSYYGISAKGLYPPSDVNSRYPKNADLRTKSWLYSSVLFWGGQMPNPTDILRKYHPYQFEVKQRRSFDFTQLDVISGDVIGQMVSNDQTGSGNEEGGAYFGYRDEDMVSTIVAAELPLHPPFSLAGFAGSRLTPGWYDDSNVISDSGVIGKRAKRISYQSGVPAVGVGNSFADPMIPANKVHYNYTEHDPDMADFWDHAFMNNDVLWDSWFTSSLSNRPVALGGTRLEMKEEVQNVVSNAFSVRNDASRMLSNRRFKWNRGNETEASIISSLTDKNSKNWEKSARYLTVEGAFNVNSTSLPAWLAVLNALKERRILYADKNTGEPKILNDSGNGENVYFSRFAVASANETRDDKTLLRIEEEQNKYRWSDLRKLKASSSPSDNSDIRKLARQIIIQVKKRGPFLNMSEFINRRLQSSDQGTAGALQAAIDAAGLNDAFKNNMELDPYAQYNFPLASAGSVQTAAPGYLIQSDVLAALGNTLTVRDDTFTIRAYGQVTNSAGTEITGRAWCEAVVQRTVDYVDPSNDPETPAVIADPVSGDLKESNLTPMNKAFGRKFKIVSFRWLSPDEV